MGAFQNFVFQSTLSVWRGTVTETVDKILDLFQSTLSVWRGTADGIRWGTTGFYFNPPSPCGEGRVTAREFKDKLVISIHPLRVERDENDRMPGGLQRISIHPLRVERDHVRRTTGL